MLAKNQLRPELSWGLEQQTKQNLSPKQQKVFFEDFFFFLK